MIAENWVYASIRPEGAGAGHAGEIGTPFMIRSTLDMDVRAGFSSGSGWGAAARSALGGGALLDAGPHCVSACRYLR